MIQRADEISDSIVDRLLRSQQELTAVEKFSQRHVSVTAPANESLYRDLIPLEAPGSDEQYSFEIDLDACSGCKACVAACHSLNGLDEGEIWRNVGLMTGGDDFNPVVQHVTSACHHCVDPGCLNGCPVRAYEKDPLTGIVEHLDDQCIGCKYCMFTCPYDVPSYSASKGIVRKCNMCADRLAVGQAPACVQACPHEAIKICTVSKTELLETVAGSDDAESSASLLPGAPSSRLTVPTTRYIGRPAAASDGLPVDFHQGKSQHAHFPLVFMLTLTQMALGLFSVALLMRLAGAAGTVLNGLNVFGFATLCAGLGVATLHLGRPTKAYRAMSGFRTSWLSREIIGFNLFAGAASGLLSATLLPFVPDWVSAKSGLLAAGTVLAGVLGVECSVMLYVVTGRPLWSAFRTHSLFFTTAVVLGLSGALLLLTLIAPQPMACRVLAGGLIVATLIKLGIESQLLRHLGSATATPEKLSAEVMMREKRPHAYARLTVAVLGGLIFPLALLIGPSSALATALAVVSFACVFAGEALERYLFFAVSVARRMPGAPN